MQCLINLFVTQKIMNSYMNELFDYQNELFGHKLVHEWIFKSEMEIDQTLHHFLFCRSLALLDLFSIGGYGVLYHKKWYQSSSIRRLQAIESVFEEKNK